MDIKDIFEASERFPNEFAKAQSFSEFAFALDASEAGVGRWFQSVAEKYADSWESAFQTVKEHGFVARALAMPAAKTFEDLFSEVALFPMQYGHFRDETHHLQMGMTFISATRADDARFAYFGPLGARYTWSPNWIKRGERIVQRSGGATYITAGKPTESLLAALQCRVGCGEWDLASIEIIRRNDGKYLAVSQTGNAIGHRWLALIEAPRAEYPLLSHKERALIEAERAARAELGEIPSNLSAWEVIGEDRHLNAIGLPEAFKITVKACGADDAQHVARLCREANGRKDILCKTAIAIEPRA